jgi:hypothetical protein
MENHPDGGGGAMKYVSANSESMQNLDVYAVQSCADCTRTAIPLQLLLYVWFIAAVKNLKKKFSFKKYCNSGLLASLC